MPFAPKHAPVVEIEKPHLVRLMVVVTLETGPVNPEKVNPVVPELLSTCSTGLKVADWVRAEAAGAINRGSASPAAKMPENFSAALRGGES